MKKRIYLRVAKGGRNGIKVDASTTPKYEPLYHVKWGNVRKYYPTVSIALDLIVPDNEFDVSRILLEACIKETEPAVEIKQVFEKKVIE